MSHVFISYHRESDAEFAETLIQEIVENLDVEYWIDRSDIRAGNEEWVKQIEEAIQSSFALILVTTPESLDRFWVNYEWIFARGAGIPVIPVQFVEIPDDLWEKEDLYKRLDQFHRRNLTPDNPKEWQELFKDIRDAQAEMRSRMNIPQKASGIVRSAAEILDRSIDEDETERSIDILKTVALESRDEYALEILKSRSMQHPIRSTRHRVALAYVECTNYSPDDWEIVEDAALHGDEDICQLAWDALGEMGGRECAEVLGDALKQQSLNLSFQEKIIENLGLTARNGDSYALNFLSERLKQSPINVRVKKAIIVALRHFRTDDASELLLGIIPDLQGAWLGEAIRSLVLIGSQKAKNGVKEYLLTAEDEDTRHTIIRKLGETNALGKTGSLVALQILRDTMNDPRSPYGTSIRRSIHQIDNYLKNNS